MQLCPYREGTLKQVNNSNKSDKAADEYEIVALAKRLNITFDDMKQMSFISLANILLNKIDEEETNATQSDIDRMFG